MPDEVEGEDDTTLETDAAIEEAAPPPTSPDEAAPEAPAPELRETEAPESRPVPYPTATPLTIVVSVGSVCNGTEISSPLKS